MKSVLIIAAITAILAITEARRNDNNNSGQNGQYDPNSQYGQNGQTNQYGQNGQNNQYGQNGQNGQNRQTGRRRGGGQNGSNRGSGQNVNGKWNNQKMIEKVCNALQGKILPINCQSQTALSQAFTTTQTICNQYRTDQNINTATTSFENQVIQPLRSSLQNLLANEAAITCLRDIGAELRGQ